MDLEKMWEGGGAESRFAQKTNAKLSGTEFEISLSPKGILVKKGGKIYKSGVSWSLVKGNPFPSQDKISKAVIADLFMEDIGFDPFLTNLVMQGEI